MLSRSEGVRACVHADHAKNDAQKGCTMQLNGITVSRNIKPADNRQF